MTQKPEQQRGLQNDKEFEAGPNDFHDFDAAAWRLEEAAEKRAKLRPEHGGDRWCAICGRRDDGPLRDCPWCALDRERQRQANEAIRVQLMERSRQGKRPESSKAEVAKTLRIQKDAKEKAGREEK